MDRTCNQIQDPGGAKIRIPKLSANFAKD